MKKRAISSKGGSSAGCLVPFFSIFLLAGIGFLFPFFILPVVKIFKARNWEPTSAKVVSSRIETLAGDEGDTYLVKVVFDYIVDGQQNRSDLYKLSSVYSGGYKNKQRIVREHPAGRQVTCYYDPADPANAVINRGFTGDVWFGLLPMIFVIVGAVGILGSLGHSALLSDPLRSSGRKK